MAWAITVDLLLGDARSAGAVDLTEEQPRVTHVASAKDSRMRPSVLNRTTAFWMLAGQPAAITGSAIWCAHSVRLRSPPGPRRHSVQWRTFLSVVDAEHEGMPS